MNDLLTPDALLGVAGKAILVAGAASGLGAAIAGLLARHGARLALADIDTDRLANAAAGAHDKCLRVACDVTDEASVLAAVAEASEQLGALDGVVNAAGLFACRAALEQDIAMFRRVMAVNVEGAFLLSRAAAAAMRDGGAIVHLASVSAHVANPGYSAYAPSKAALAHLVRVLAREWAPRNIRVNAIGPAMTETPLTEAYLDDPERRARALAQIPLGRFGRPEDLFAPLLLLLAPGGAFITGQILYVDGGRTLV